MGTSKRREAPVNKLLTGDAVEKFNIYEERLCNRCGMPYKKNKMISGDDVCGTCDGMNELAFWYPRLYRLGFPMPSTIILHNLVNLELLAYGDRPKGIETLCKRVRHAGEALGFPVFLRTGLMAAKHSWKESCFVTVESNIEKHLYHLAEASGLACIDRFASCDFIVVREMLETVPYFTYFNGDMPITKERRFFIRNGKVECHHSYWPRDVFPDKDDATLKDLNLLTAEEEKELTGMATYVANCFTGFWSCDFLKTKKGWYLTDMAIGERSFHQPHKEELP